MRLVVTTSLRTCRSRPVNDGTKDREICPRQQTSSHLQTSPPSDLFVSLFLIL